MLLALSRVDAMSAKKSIICFFILLNMGTYKTFFLMTINNNNNLLPEGVLMIE
jgi:hypothetical protein